MSGKYSQPAAKNPRPGEYNDAAATYDEIIALRASSRSGIPTPLSEILHTDPVLNLANAGFFISRRSRLDEIDPTKDTRLGWTTLTVPPEEIDIIEDRYNEEIDILRGRGSALVKTGRGHIRIRMPIRFATLKDVNRELRPIVAQFRTCPFTMLESDTVAIAVLLKHADTGSIEAIRKAREVREVALQNYKSVKNKAIEKLGRYKQQIVTALGRTYDDLAEELHKESPASIQTVLKTLISYYTRLPVSDPTSEDRWWRLNKDLVQDLEVIKGHAEEADKLLGALFDKSRELAEAELRASFAYPAVPVALHQLVCQTVPGYPEMLRADLEMFYFNTEPFMSVTTFVGPTGNPTGDITECQAYKDHVDQRLGPDARHDAEHITLNTGLGFIHEDTNGFLSLQYPTTKWKRVKKDTPKLSEQEYVIPAPVGSAIEDDFEYRVVPEKLVVPKADKNIIIDKVVVSLENKLSPQPIEGHMYGTLQYMGQMNAKIQITMTVTGDSETEMASHLQKIHELKKQTEEVAHVFGEKARRNTRITIDHDLVRLFGVQNVLLDRIRTRTKAINTTEVTLYLTEYTTTLEKRERLMMSGTESKTKIQTEGLVYLADVVAAYLHGYGTAEGLNQVSRTWDGPRWATDVMYGGFMAGIRAGHQTEGILTEEVMAEVLYRTPIIKEVIENRLDIWREYEHLRRAKKTKVSKRDLLRHQRYFRRKEELIRHYGSWDKVHESNRAHLKLLGSMLPQATLDIDLDAQRKHFLRQMAKDHIQYWSSRQLHTPGLTPESDGPETIMDSSGMIEIPQYPTKEMLKEAVLVIHSGEVDYRLAGRLAHTIERAQSVFSTLQRRITDIREAMAPSLVYPDLDLPDYATAFAGLWAAIKKQTGIDIIQEKDLNEAQLPPKIKAVVHRIIPSYSDLGIRTPEGRSVRDFAREVTDLVDPDYYFFWNKVKDNSEMIQMLDTAVAEAATLDAELQAIDPSQPDTVPNRADLSRAKAEMASRMIPGARNPVSTTKYEDDPSPKETTVEMVVKGKVTETNGTVQKLPALTGGGVGTDFKYRSPHPELQEKLDNFNPYDDHHRRRLFKAAIDSVPDRFRRLVTAFPAFKLQLIETDNEEWMLWDDFYGYNSIKSIRIYNHKYTPAIAEIEVVNVTGNLDESRAVSSDQERDAIAKRYRTGGASREKNTGDQNKLDHFFLDAGTPITIRLGYSSKLEELEVRFVGQIVSASAGDITRLVAQCYSSELTVPLNEIIKGRNWFAIANRIMEKSPTRHYGAAFNLLARGRIDRRGLRNTYTGWLVESKSRRAVTGVDTVGGVPESVDDTPDDLLMNSAHSVRAWPRSLGQKLLGKLGYLPSLPKRFVGEILSNRKTTNVFLPLENNYRRAIDEGSGPPWGIPNVTGLSALHELTRYLPGYVCGTRP